MADRFSGKRTVFENPETEYLVEFPDGPLSVGEEPVKEIMDEMPQVS